MGSRSENFVAGGGVSVSRHAGIASGRVGFLYIQESSLGRIWVTVSDSSHASTAAAAAAAAAASNDDEP